MYSKEILHFVILISSLLKLPVSETNNSFNGLNFKVIFTS